MVTTVAKATTGMIIISHVGILGFFISSSLFFAVIHLELWTTYFKNHVFGKIYLMK